MRARRDASISGCDTRGEKQAGPGCLRGKAQVCPSGKAKIVNQIITDFNTSQSDFKVELQSFPQA